MLDTISIGDGVFIGNNTAVSAGADIGDDSIVASMTIVDVCIGIGGKHVANWLIFSLWK